MVGLRRIRIGEIIDVDAFDLVREVMWHGALIDGRAEQLACHDVDACVVFVVTARLDKSMALTLSTCNVYA